MDVFAEIIEHTKSSSLVEPAQYKQQMSNYSLKATFDLQDW